MKQILLEQPVVVDVECPFCGFNYSYNGGFDARVEGGPPRPKETDEDGNPVELFQNVSPAERSVIHKTYSSLGMYLFNCPNPACNKELLHINPKKGKNAQTLPYAKVANKLKPEAKEFLEKYKELLSFSAKTSAIKHDLLRENLTFKNFCEYIDNVSYSLQYR